MAWLTECFLILFWLLVGATLGKWAQGPVIRLGERLELFRKRRFQSQPEPIILNSIEYADATFAAHIKRQEYQYPQFPLPLSHEDRELIDAIEVLELKASGPLGRRLAVRVEATQRRVRERQLSVDYEIATVLNAIRKRAEGIKS